MSIEKSKLEKLSETLKSLRKEIDNETKEEIMNNDFDEIRKLVSDNKEISWILKQKLIIFGINLTDDQYALNIIYRSTSRKKWYILTIIDCIIDLIKDYDNLINVFNSICKNFSI